MFQTITISLILILAIVLDGDIYSLNSILSQIDQLINFLSNIFSHGTAYQYLIFLWNLCKFHFLGQKNINRIGRYEN